MSKAKKVSVSFLTDPGHGWLSVKRSDLRELGIAYDITPYSYQNGDRVYLEEDCDANKFLVAAESSGLDCQG